MDISLQPEYYKPSVDDNGKFIDSLISFNLEAGIICPCIANKNKIFNCKTKFNSHKKTKTHKLWLENLNGEKNNLYIENLQLKELLDSQKKIIAKYDIELMKKNAIIDFLSETKNISCQQESINLLDI